MVERVFQHPANRRTLNMKTGDMMNTSLIFSGIQIWEAQFLPTDILLDLDLIREWAISKGLVFDEGQFVSHEDAHEAAQLFTPDDGLQILVDLFPEDSSAVKYMEYIYVPISRLIKRDLEIRLIFWRTQTNLVQFGFWVKHSFLEYTSQSTGPIIVRKFSEQLEKLAGSFPTIDLMEADQIIGREISEIDGAIKARFTRSGRAFDVMLT